MIEYERDTAAIAQLIAIVLSVAALILSALQRVGSNKTIASGHLVIVKSHTNCIRNGNRSPRCAEQVFKWRLKNHCEQNSILKRT